MILGILKYCIVLFCKPAILNDCDIVPGGCCGDVHLF